MITNNTKGSSNTATKTLLATSLILLFFVVIIDDKNLFVTPIIRPISLQKTTYSSTWLQDSFQQPIVKIGGAGAAIKGNKVDLPFYDIIVVSPGPWTWVERRQDVYQAWLKGDTRTNKTSALIFPIAAGSKPATLDPRDQLLYYNRSFSVALKSFANRTKIQTKRKLNPSRLYPPSSATIITVPCEDLDGSTGGGQVPSNCSTLCKFVEGICYAAERYRFNYLAKVDGDTYFRWDYFVEKVSPTLPNERLWMGMRLTDGKVPQTTYFKNLWHFDTNPPYMSGMGSIITADLAYYLCSMWRTNMVKSPYPEDGTIGLYLYPLQLNVVDSGDFHTRRSSAKRNWRQQDCTERSIMIHYMEHDDWTNMDENGVARC